MVPLFVLNELQIISDSADATKRNRGRRGLDILKDMQDANKVAIEVVENDYDDLTEVDSKLMRLALDKQWKLMTNDFNLNKVARVQGIEVLNLNELANVLKPALIAGEWIRVQVMKEGKEVHQGVAYLDDGTMIVVEDGKPYVGQNVEVMVTSILQTSAGRMIFARVDGGTKMDKVISCIVLAAGAGRRMAYKENKNIYPPWSVFYYSAHFCRMLLNYKA